MYLGRIIKCGHLLRVANYLDQLVALFVYQQFALDALESLTAQTPNTVMTVGTRSSLHTEKKTLIWLLFQNQMEKLANLRD